jgi:hypothetical protein
VRERNPVFFIILFFFLLQWFSCSTIYISNVTVLLPNAGKLYWAGLKKIKWPVSAASSRRVHPNILNIIHICT